ncbi:hypothetical protein MUK42_35414 [Musa troglodytarum]|uniref:Uncharacterized protein n=1 Tax=Musa troglodytarum TaxID=320322 RepID=A0A9E7JDH5_9LILI|nr:hypothetical protein MUK42_35414 [Musa troglodytarum]
MLIYMYIEPLLTAGPPPPPVTSVLGPSFPMRNARKVKLAKEYRHSTVKFERKHSRPERYDRNIT